MSDPLRLRVQKELALAFRQIKPENGFQSDFSGDEGTSQNKVFRGRLYFGDDDPLPMISILEEPIAPETDLEPRDGQGGVSPYNLMIQGFAKDDIQNPTDPAHVLLADVKKKLAELKEQSVGEGRVFQFPKESPTVTEVTFGGGVVRPPDEISAKAYFWLKVTFELFEDHKNPYV